MIRWQQPTMDLHVSPPPVPKVRTLLATNYDPLAATDNGSCTYPLPVPGCMDPLVANLIRWQQPTMDLARTLPRQCMTVATMVTSPILCDSTWVTYRNKMVGYYNGSCTIPSLIFLDDIRGIKTR
jgi:hypothetical protein